MASINGIKIKNLKSFRGHEGEELVSGDVWYCGKKLGHWSQDSWGGPDYYDFDENQVDAAVKKYAMSEYVEDENRDIIDLSILLYELVILMDNEKAFKTAIKKGYKSYVIGTDRYHKRAFYAPTADKDTIKNTDFYKNFVKTCNEIAYKNKKMVITIYSSLDDFDVMVA